MVHGPARAGDWEEEHASHNSVRAFATVHSLPVRVDPRPDRVYAPASQELSAGRITQAEYDELSGGISEEEYAAEVAQQQVELSSDAKKVLKNMRSETGVEFAPWMQVDAEAIAKAKKDREARKARLAATARSDSMLIDPQAAELGAGGGLKSNVLSEDEVELRWDTQDESGNAGFIVQRRRGGALR